MGTTGGPPQPIHMWVGQHRVSFAHVLEAHTRSPAQGRPGAHTTGPSLTGRRAQAPLGVQGSAGSGVASLLTEGRWPGARVWAGGGPDLSGNAGGPVVPYFVVTVHTASGEAGMITATGPGR